MARTDGTTKGNSTMETESKTLTVRESQQGGHTVVQRGVFEHVVLTPADLQTLVQYAYDAHGILADPSYAAEAERVTEAKAGGCPCGFEGCSDRTGDGPDPIREGLQQVFA